MWDSKLRIPVFSSTPLESNCLIDRLIYLMGSQKGEKVGSVVCKEAREELSFGTDTGSRAVSTKRVGDA